MAEAKHIDIGVKGQAEARIVADEGHLITIVKNLVDNAIRYTPSGGRIDLSVRVRQDSVDLQIDDTGPGIPIEERQRVFDPFYRVLGSEAVGSGLGLSIVKTIADRIDARIYLACSNPRSQSGLCVTVTLPKTVKAPSA